jgi:hypothetical protein
MKKFLTIILVSGLLSLVSARADEESPWGDFDANLNIPNAAPVVTDQEFQKAIDSKLKKKKKNKNIPKGNMFRNSDETTFINDVPEDLPVIPIPLDLVIEDRVLPSGHYQVKGEKIDGKTVLKFYQAHYLIAQLPVIEINDDFGEKNINFIKLIDHSDTQVKLIFGNLEFNAYRIIDLGGR